MEHDERRSHLATLAATPGRLKEVLRGARKADLTFTPAPGKWSMLEIVCHLRDMEREAYLARYRRLLAEDDPRLPDIEGERLALERDYRSAKLADALRDWRAARRETLALLRRLKAGDWARSGVHESAGPLTVETLLRRQAVGNDEAHLQQLAAIRPRNELLARLERAPAELGAALRGVDDALLRRRPAPGKWSMIEIACHLRDIEAVFAPRFSKMAFGERPAFWMLDNDVMAERLRYREADPAAVVKEWKRRRAETLTLLRALPSPVWQRTGLHPERGELTIDGLARHLAGHDRRHLDALVGLRA